MALEEKPSNCIALVTMDKDEKENDSPPLSEYEKLRLSKIARNQAKLKSLGLWKDPEDSKKNGNATTNASSKKRRLAKAAERNKSPSSRRRSARLTQTSIVKQEDDSRIVTPDTIKSSYRVEEEDEDDVILKNSLQEDLLRKMKDEIENLRSQQPFIPEHVSSCGDSVIVKQESKEEDEEDFKNASKLLWGDGCNPPSDCSWKTFFTSRKASPPKELPSPLGMYQELYAHDGWKILICCALMSRVSSLDTKDRCIRGFFQLCPTPSHVADVNVEELQTTVHSLGFQYERVKAISEITRAWLTRGEFKIDSVDESKGGNKIYMCGPFVIDSYHLFCKGQMEWKPTCKIRDVERFSKWLKKHSINSVKK